MTAPLAQRLAHAGLDWIVPEWDAPANVHALSTTRHGGTSVGARASLDLGPAILPQDASRDVVLESRRRLQRFLPSAPIWMSQVHGADVVVIDDANVPALSELPPTADAAVTRLPGVVLGVRTADCLPVVFADRAGSVVGVAHAGWRGLAAGVLEATVLAMRVPPAAIVAWMGPAIGPQKFEVGRDVFDAFCVPDSGAAQHFAGTGGNDGLSADRDPTRLAADRDPTRLSADRDPTRLPADRDPKWLANIYGLARRRLGRVGVTTIAGGGLCTLTDADRLFSYRADMDAGRMATLVWRDA